MEKLNLQYDTNVLSNGDRTILIQHDEFAESPRMEGEGNLCHIYTWNPNCQYGDYNFGNVKKAIDTFLEKIPDEKLQFIRLNGRSVEEIVYDIDQILKEEHMLIPLVYTVHGTESLRIGYYREKYDGSFSGMVHISKEDFERWGIPYNEHNFRESAMKVIDNEIDALNDYIQGNCYEISCYEGRDCVECIGGYYLDEKNGYDMNALFQEVGAGYDENSWLVVDENCKEFSVDMDGSFDIDTFLLKNFPERYQIVEIDR